MRKWILALAIAAGVLLMPALEAAALSIGVAVELDANGDGEASLVNPLGALVENGDVSTWTLSAPAELEGITINSWQVQLKEDPFVTNNINVTNTSATTQTFVATVLLGIPAFSYNQIVSSSVGVTVTDSNGNGSMSLALNGGTPLYQGTVNGSTELSLTPASVPIELADCPIVFAGCSATDSTGVAAVAASGLANSIGITLTFDLSPGDSAGITSRFEIIPEPGTAMLLGLGLLGMGLARRR